MTDTVEMIITLVGVTASAVVTPFFVRELLLRERTARRRRERTIAAVRSTDRLLTVDTAPLVSPVPRRVQYPHGLRPADSSHLPAHVAAGAGPLRAG